MNPRDRESLKDTLKYASYIQDFLSNKTFETFSDDMQCKFAVLRCFSVIKLATTKFSNPFKLAYPDIPGQKIDGLQTILSHTYNDINDRYIWNTATHAIPDLIHQVNAILEPDSSATGV